MLWQRTSLSPLSSSTSLSLEEKADLVPGSVEHGRWIAEQGAQEQHHETSAQLLLHAARALSAASAHAEARAARHAAARRLLAASKLQEALSVLQENARHSSEGVERVQSEVSVALVEIMLGNTEKGLGGLQQCMHQLHRELGRHHPLSHQVQKLWLVSELQEKDFSLLMKHV